MTRPVAHFSIVATGLVFATCPRAVHLIVSIQLHSTLCIRNKAFFFVSVTVIRKKKVKEYFVVCFVQLSNFVFWCFLIYILYAFCISCLSFVSLVRCTSLIHCTCLTSLALYTVYLHCRSWCVNVNIVRVFVVKILKTVGINCNNTWTLLVSTLVTVKTSQDSVWDHLLHDYQG